MAHSNNEAVEKFWGAYSGRSAAKVRAFALALKEVQGDFPEMFRAPMGNEQPEFKAGDKAITTDQGVVKPGLEVTVEKVEKVWGFCRYLVLGQWVHQGDIAPLPESEE